MRSLLPLERLDITPEMVMGADLSTSQLVGGAVAWLQCGGLLVPSARDKEANIVVFVRNMAPTDTLEPISQEQYPPNDPGSGMTTREPT